MRNRDTRAAIMETARRLFNKKGTKPVSTNHIAEEMGISSGNLYYHFKNKEEIIRAIFEKMTNETAAFWQFEERERTLEHFLDRMHRASLLVWNYRFLPREICALLQRDPILRKRYQELWPKRYKDSESFFRGLIRSGILRGLEDDATLHLIMKFIFFIEENWILYLDTRGEKINRRSVQESMDMVIHVLRPYLSEEALAGLLQNNRSR